MFIRLGITFFALFALVFEWWVRKPTFRFRKESYPKGNIIRIVFYLLVTILLCLFLLNPSPATLNILYYPLSSIPKQAIILVEVLGWALFGTGWILAFFGRRCLDTLWCPGAIRNVELGDGHFLIKTGPYKIVRHPIYVGEVLMLLGLYCIYHIWPLIIAFFDRFVLVLVRTNYEEKSLATKFGDKWIDYKKRVPRFIPRVIKLDFWKNNKTF